MLIERLLQGAYFKARCYGHCKVYFNGRCEADKIKYRNENKAV